MNFANNLKKIRKEHNLSQEQLAEKLNVSRQSVSKWESSQAYPEMDKMVQICNMFNLNMDDLLNQDIKEVNNKKEAKGKINNFIDDFLKYVTKTIDLFSNMKFRMKIKCLFEQIVIIIILVLAFNIIGILCSNILFNTLVLLPDKVYYFLHNLLSSIYIVGCCILGTALIFHIFKVRYLDYYDVEDDIGNNETNNNETNVEVNNLIKNNKKNTEKIIIRDPKHSEYRFINGILRFLILIFKTFLCLVGSFFVLSFCSLAFIFLISFLFIKTGCLFLGLIMLITSFIIINYIIIRLIYNFVFSAKSSKRIMFILFIISILGIGLASGLLVIGITKFDYVDNVNYDGFIKETKTISMSDSLILNDHYDNAINYIESNRNDILIEVYHHKYYYFTLDNYENIYYYNISNYGEFKMPLIRTIIDDINKHKVVNYGAYVINIYASKNNIDLLKKNKDIYNNNF